MSDWTKLEDISPTASIHYSDIWRTEGWQINRATRPTDRPFVLLDTNMPFGVPASSVMGCYATLKEAQDAADRFGPMDWSELQDDSPVLTQGD